MPEVKLYGSLRLRGGIARATVPGATVREVLAALCEGNDDLCAAIYNGQELRPFVRITVGGHDIILAEGLDTPVAESDSLAIFPPIAGG
ncbi:MAG: hypothetical protein Kow00124_26880 [Anaerolineae bacterium]